LNRFFRVKGIRKPFSEAAGKRRKKERTGSVKTRESNPGKLAARESRGWFQTDFFVRRFKEDSLRDG